MSAKISSELVLLHVAQICSELHEMLVAKNKAYGNSALDPVRIFSKADPVEQIKVRLDDKLSRLSRGEAAGEDVCKDLLGYLVLLEVAKRIEAGLFDPHKRVSTSVSMQLDLAVKVIVEHCKIHQTNNVSALVDGHPWLINAKSNAGTPATYKREETVGMIPPEKVGIVGSGP